MKTTKEQKRLIAEIDHQLPFFIKVGDFKIRRRLISRYVLMVYDNMKVMGALLNHCKNHAKLYRKRK